MLTFDTRTAVSPLSYHVRRSVLSVLVLVLCVSISAQVDTVFWFAAPDFSDGHGDVPIYMRFTTLEESADVIISQPANPLFVPVDFNIPANSSYTLDMSPLKDLVEGTPPDVVLQKGLLIRSSAFMNVYYENASFYNPEIFTLKGRNSLGTDFVIPMQHLFPNGNYRPVPYASFNIIATEDNTQVTITPAHNIVGHASGVPYAVVLNKGETYVARAAQTNAGVHLGGSFVSSDKPIAVTISDDSMSASSVYGGCSDLGGDQITPVHLLGTRYITVPGSLNGPNDAVFVYGVSDNTEVTINGVLTGSVNRGTFIHSFSRGAPMIIETSQPAYVLHMSGFGCEVGLDQMPPLDPCNGSRVLSINRSSNQPLFINILVYKGLTESFEFNGRTDVIEGTDFTEVPGSNGDWFFANIQIPLNVMAVGEAALIRNTEGPFQLSVIHGGPGTGTMYGYFSDYGRLEVLPELQTSCAGGTTLFLDTTYVSYRWSTGDTSAFLEINESGKYSVTVTNEFGCVASDSIFMDVLPEARESLKFDLCPNDSIQVAGEWFGAFRDSGEVFLPQATIHGCDSFIQITLDFYPEPTGYYSEDLCPGERVEIGGEWFDETRTGGVVKLSGSSVHGCDSFVQVSLSFFPPARSQFQGALCEGDSLNFAGQWFSATRPSGKVVLPGASVHGCDSTVEVQFQILRPDRSMVQMSLCPDQAYQVGNQIFDQSRPEGQVVLTNKDGCDSIVSVQLSFYPEPLGERVETICRGDTFRLGELILYDGYELDTMFQPGASRHGCDSFTIVSLNFYEVSSGAIELDACPGERVQVHGVTLDETHLSDTVILQGRNQFGCDSVLALSVKYFPPALGTFSDTLCPGETIQIGGTRFDRNRTNGTIQLAGASQHGCDSVLEVDLFFPENELSLPKSYTIDYGAQVQFIPQYRSFFEKWSWDPGWGLSCEDCERPWALGTESGKYTLSGTDPFGCVYTAGTRLVVRKDKKVFIPNAITPNNDGNNDRFTAFGNYFAERIEFVEIYDRWGNRIIRIEDIPLNEPFWGWDATHQGQDVMPGVYVYYLKVRFLDQSREVYYGDVTVLR